MHVHPHGIFPNSLLAMSASRPITLHDSPSDAVANGSNAEDDTRPSIPEPEKPDPDQVRNDHVHDLDLERGERNRIPHQGRRRPLILHPVAGWALVACCTVLTVVIAVLYWLSEKHQGLFPTHTSNSFRDDMFQLVWSSSPAFFLTILSSSVLIPMAFYIWWHAPFVELENGPSDANVSIFMNWITKGLLERIYLAWKHQRVGLVTLGLASLISSSLPIAASGILSQRNVVVRIWNDLCD